MSYKLDYESHHGLVLILAPFLQAASDPSLSIPESHMASSALIDILVPEIVKIVEKAVSENSKVIALATGRG